MGSISEEMESEWDERAHVDPLHFIESAHRNSDIDSFFERGEERAKLIIDPFLDDWDQYQTQENGLTALDVGCGVGRMSRPLNERFDRVIGLDVSDEMIAKAKELNKNNNSIEYHSTDGLSYSPVPSKSVEFVFSYEVFQHMPTTDVVRVNLSEIQRVLAPSGRCCIHFRPNVPVSAGPLTLPKQIFDLIPVPIKTIYSKAIDSDYGHLKASDTWSGAALSVPEFWQYLDNAGLSLVGFFPDPTYQLGDRLFAIAEK